MDSPKSYDDTKWPGKFEGNIHQGLARYLHELSMDGQYWEQTGTTTEPPFVWQALMEIDVENAVEFPFYDQLQRGYIITEDEHGFFSYVGYDTFDEAAEVWWGDIVNAKV